MHIGGIVFRFISHPDYLLEDGLWQLNSYCHIPAAEYKHGQTDNVPISLEEEFGDEVCSEIRKDVAKTLTNNLIQFKLISWPGASLPELHDKISQLQKDGVNITVAA